MYVEDPAPGGSRRSYLFSDSMGSNKTKGSIANPRNYLIVPANYTEQQAKDFAARITEAWYRLHPGDETGTAGPNQALIDMAEAFLPGGPQDLQRHPQWGVPKGSVVPAFVGSASNHLGYVTALTPVPLFLSEMGGGAANGSNAFYQWLQRRIGKPADDIDTSGPYWLSQQNHANIVQGSNDAPAVNNPSSPFNDYGYGSQPQRTPGQIGDGNGISGFSTSLAGVDPQQSAPPTWPPLASGPIRYLARVR